MENLSLYNYLLVVTPSSTLIYYVLQYFSNKWKVTYKGYNNREDVLRSIRSHSKVMDEAISDIDTSPSEYDKYLLYGMSASLFGFISLSTFISYGNAVSGNDTFVVYTLFAFTFDLIIALLLFFFYIFMAGNIFKLDDAEDELRAGKVNPNYSKEELRQKRLLTYYFIKRFNVVGFGLISSGFFQSTYIVETGGKFGVSNQYYFFLPIILTIVVIITVILTSSLFRRFLNQEQSYFIFRNHPNLTVGIFLYTNEYSIFHQKPRLCYITGIGKNLGVKFKEFDSSPWYHTKIRWKDILMIGVEDEGLSELPKSS